MPSTLSLLWQEQRLLMLLIPSFLVALGGMLYAKTELTGIAVPIVALFSFVGVIGVMILGMVYFPYKALQSNHFNLNIDTYDGQPDLFWTEGRRRATELLEGMMKCPSCLNVFYWVNKYKMSQDVAEIECPSCNKKGCTMLLGYWETGYALDKPVNFTNVLAHDGLPLYPDSESCELVFFRHWGTTEERIHLHGEMALYDGFPVWHRASETLNTRALQANPYEVRNGELIYSPTFEIVATLAKDFDRFAKYQIDIWKLIIEKEAKENKEVVPLVSN